MAATNGLTKQKYTERLSEGAENIINIILNSVDLTKTMRSAHVCIAESDRNGQNIFSTLESMTAPITLVFINLD